MKENIIWRYTARKVRERIQLAILLVQLGGAGGYLKFKLTAYEGMYIRISVGAGWDHAKGIGRSSAEEPDHGESGGPGDSTKVYFSGHCIALANGGKGAEVHCRIDGGDWAREGAPGTYYLSTSFSDICEFVEGMDGGNGDNNGGSFKLYPAITNYTVNYSKGDSNK